MYALSSASVSCVVCVAAAEPAAALGFAAKAEMRPSLVWQRSASCCVRRVCALDCDRGIQDDERRGDRQTEAERSNGPQS